jgi:maltooligosyltrehalose trehalohydrolase
VTSSGCAAPIRPSHGRSERDKHAAALRLHTELIALRKSDPVIGAPVRVDGAVIGEHIIILRFFAEDGADRLLLVNFGPTLSAEVLAEPLLAPPAGGAWEIRWSSDDPAYGGEGILPLDPEGSWNIAGQAAVLLGPKPSVTQAAAS